MTRGARALFAVALASAALLGFLLVRTFRSPALEMAAASSGDEAPDTGREPVPPEATMPGAPDSGWPATAGGGSGMQGTVTAPAPPVMAVAQPVAPPAEGETAPAGSVRSYIPSETRPLTPRRRAYTDADLRAYVATRGATAATRDSGYVLALRQRRVDDLRARLANADSADERATLQGWLDAALRDVQRARQ